MPVVDDLLQMVLETDPDPKLVLGTDLVIRGVNPAYARATRRSADELVGVPMFEAFPENPDDPACDGPAMLRSSLEQVLDTARVHHMHLQRYDIPVPDEERFEERHWIPVNQPLRVEGRVEAVVHRVHDVTPLVGELTAVLRRHRAVLEAYDAGTGEGPPDLRRVTDGLTALIRDHRELTEEVRALRRALTSRATIDQAKGLVMAERRCTPEEAFTVLVKLSNETNVRVADVAAALVYRAGGPDETDGRVPTP